MGAATNREQAIPATTGAALAQGWERTPMMRALILLFVLANPDGDCTKSGDCPRGEYCKAGTCVPKGEDNANHI